MLKANDEGKFMPSMIHLRNTYKISGLCEAVSSPASDVSLSKIGKFTNFQGAVSSSDDGYSLTGPYQTLIKKKTAEGFVCQTE